MVIIYATIMADEKMFVNNERLNIKLDNHYLENKILVMDKDYYLNYGYQYESNRIIVIGKTNLSNELDVEYHENIYKLTNSKYFKDQELYIVGSNKLIKEAIPLSEKMIFNIIDKYLEDSDITSLSFPKYDYPNWQLIQGDLITPITTRVILGRINPYGYKELNKPKKRVKK